MKLSVIIPVYNVEEFIEECIKSVVNQTFRDMEILIIDDGSEDESINIVKGIDDSRIKIITQENGGLSNARNTGIKSAVGDYIVFIDSDDFLVNNNSLQEMYDQIKDDQSDILVGNAIAIYEDGRRIKMPRNEKIFKKNVMTSEEFLLLFLKNKSMLAPVWLNMYESRLLKDTLFKEGILHEDEEFTPRIFLKSKKISIYPKEFYGYRQREGSISKSKNMVKNSRDIINTCIFLESQFDLLENEELKILYKDYLCMLMIYALRISNKTHIDTYLHEFLLRNSYTRKNKIKSMLIKRFPRVFLNKNKY